MRYRPQCLQGWPRDPRCQFGQEGGTSASTRENMRPKSAQVTP